MERCFAEKVTRLTEIRVRYELQIKQKQEAADYEATVALQEAMDKELASVSKILDDKRKVSIARARGAFNVH
jgi:hypothetical protein